MFTQEASSVFSDIFSSQRDIRQRHIAPTHPIRFYKTKSIYQMK